MTSSNPKKCGNPLLNNLPSSSDFCSKFNKEITSNVKPKVFINLKSQISEDKIQRNNNCI